MKLWKVLGLAGLAGVAATGVIIAREQRQRSQLTPEEIRGRLQERLQHAAGTGQTDAMPESMPKVGRIRRCCRRRGLADGPGS